MGKPHGVAETKSVGAAARLGLQLTSSIFGPALTKTGIFLAATKLAKYEVASSCTLFCAQISLDDTWPMAL